MNGDTGKNYLKEYIKSIKPILNEYLVMEEEKAKDVGWLPSNAVKHFNDLVAEGKGIRGCLVCLGYEANGGKDLKSIYDTSTFVELFHSGVLVHDDFMDRDNIRRGVETLNSVYKKYGEKINVKTDYTHYGNAMAVSLGDAALFMSWEKLLSGNFSAERLMAAGKLYAKYVIRLAHGQMLDITSGADVDISEKEILQILWTKSGEYTSLMPMMVGATLANEVDAEQYTAIENYARCFGWAFQIQDDYLGIFGEEAETKKPITSDLREGKNTLFMYHLRKLGNKDQLEFQKAVLGKEDVSKEEVYKMRNILRDSGTMDHVLKMGWDYVNEGKKYIKGITSDTRLQEVFESLLIFMMERTK